MIIKSKKIWMDGKFVDWDKANVHILTHTLHYGLGVFEGIRCYELASGSSAFFRLQEHMQRLFDSAHMFNLKIPFTAKELIKASLDLFKINKLKSGYLRPLVYLGAGSMGLNYQEDNLVRVSLAAWPWGTYLGDKGVKNGIRAKVASFARHRPNIMLPKAKACGNYVNSILAKKEALNGGYEEALMMDTEGYLVEASAESLFIIRDGMVRTPPMESSALKSITRDSVIAILKNEQVPLTEEKFLRDDAYIADEIFITGTAAEVCPIRELDDRRIGTGRPGPITQKIQKIFFDVVKGKVEKYGDWLTPL